MQPTNAKPVETARLQPRHLFLIASKSPPRMVHGGGCLQSLQLVIVDANDTSWSGDGAIGPLPALPPPQMLQRQTSAPPAVMPREVTGELLRDARGRLYERVGEQVRVVNQLCHDSRGQVIDLLPLRMPPKEAPPAAPPPPVARTAIPEEFCKPWELHHSRDEAIYDMHADASRSPLRRFLQRMWGGISSRDMKKWQTLLSGKTVDQQLWSIAPPRGAFNDARVSRWLAQALRFGGYDVARMQVEWQIHWRRRAS